MIFLDVSATVSKLGSGTAIIFAPLPAPPFLNSTTFEKSSGIIHYLAAVQLSPTAASS